MEKTREGSYRVSTENDVSLFDGLIIATPIELSEIELDGITKPAGESQEYQKVYTKIMKGFLRPQHFGLGNSMKLPTTVLTTKEADPITHIGIQRIPEKQCLVTVSSPKSISDDFFDGMFEKRGSPVLEQSWTAAYPRFKPIKKLPLSQIDERLICLNSIEAAVSSMETTALSALNAMRIMKAELS